MSNLSHTEIEIQNLLNERACKYEVIRNKQKDIRELDSKFEKVIKKAMELPGKWEYFSQLLYVFNTPFPGIFTIEICTRDNLINELWMDQTSIGFNFRTTIDFYKFMKLYNVKIDEEHGRSSLEIQVGLDHIKLDKCIDNIVEKIYRMEDELVSLYKEQDEFKSIIEELGIDRRINDD